jgi:hypothetical protein
MAIIKGNKVWKATQYELYEVLEGYKLEFSPDCDSSRIILRVNGMVVPAIGSYDNVRYISYVSLTGEAEALIVENLPPIYAEGIDYYLTSDVYVTGIEH